MLDITNVTRATPSTTYEEFKTEPVSYREAEQYVADLICLGQREFEKESSRFAARYMKNKCAAK